MKLARIFLAFFIFLSPNGFAEETLEKNDDWKFNYKSACIFSDFLITLLPPINNSLIKSKNTFELDNTWLQGIYGYDSRSKYYVNRGKNTEVYFIKTPTNMLMHEASIRAAALPPQYSNPDYLSWAFDFKKEFLFSGKKKIGCESITLSFEFSPLPEQKLLLVNLESFID